MASSGFKLYDALIRPLRDADRDQGALLLQRYLKGPQATHDRTESDVQTLLDQVRPDKVRSDLVKYLKDIVGFTIELRSITDRLTEAQLRRLIALAVPMWNERSTERGIVNAVRLLTGRTAFLTNWFGYRNLLGETGIFEDQLTTGGDNWIIGGSISTYDESLTNVRLMDDGTLDETLLVDLVRLERALSERVEIFLDDFLDKFDGELDKWSVVAGTTPTVTTTDEMSVPSGTEVQPIVPILAVDGQHLDYNFVSKFRLEAAASKLVARWYVEDSARYDLEIKLTSPRLLLRHYDSAGAPTTLFSGDPTSVSLVAGTWYKLRVTTNNVGADRHIQVMLDSNLVIPATGSALVHTPSNGMPSAGPYRFSASGGAVLLDNVESWRNPARFATVGLSTLAAPGGALVASADFLAKKTPLFFTSAATFAAATGKDAKSIYLFDQASGSVVDVVSGLNLAVVGAPTFRRSVGGKKGVAYDTLLDAHRADVNILGLKSGVMGVVFSSFDATDVTQHIWGSGDPGDAFRLRMQYQGGDATLNAQVQSGLNLTLSLTVPAGDNVLRLLQLQVSRGEVLARLRSSRRGVVQATSGSISGHGSYSGGTQRFGAGDLVGTQPGVAVHYAYHIEGAQSEGVDVLKDLATAHGFE